jgi:hypothetical protein
MAAGHPAAGANAGGSHAELDAGHLDAASDSDAGGADCEQIASDYGDAISDAKMCQVGATGQCQILVSTTLPCPTCQVHVNDDHTLQTLKQRYQDAACKPPRFCPAIACVNPGVPNCAPINSGDRCQ